MQQDDRRAVAEVGPRDPKRFVAQPVQLDRSFLCRKASWVRDAGARPVGMIQLLPFRRGQYCSDFSETSWYQRLRVPIFERIFQPIVFGAASMASSSAAMRSLMTPR